MFVDLQIHPDSDKCPSCIEWGETRRNAVGGVVHCPSCGRPTAPNLGVNLPAGAAWAHSGVQAHCRLLSAQELHGDLERIINGHGDGV